MSETTRNEVKGSLKILVAIAFIGIVIWPFWRPALWALAVVRSISGLRERALARGRARWAFSPGAMTLWVALCLLIPFASHRYVNHRRGHRRCRKARGSGPA